MSDEKLPKNYKTRSPAVWTGLIMGGLFGLFALLLAIGLPIPTLPSLAWPHFATVGLLIATGSEAYFSVSRQRRQHRIEERFPDLMRNWATNHSSGLTMAATISKSAEGDYGELDDELQLMAAQLSFNAPVGDVLQGFAERVDSPLVTRSIALLQDAMQSGSRTTRALTAAANDASRIQQFGESRSAQLGQYVAVVYVAFFVFIVVVFVLSNYFVSQVFSGDSTLVNNEDAANVFANPEMEATFASLFIWAGTVSGAGSGLVIGALLRGKPTTGLNHSFVLIALGYAVTFGAGFL